MISTSTVVLLLTIASSACFSYNASDCTITEFSQVSIVTQTCKVITISNLSVPGGETLKLDLLKGSTLTFQGVVTFEVAYWKGYLVQISGENILVQGSPGSILNGQGEKYWDGLGGDGGVTKPRFFRILATANSIFRDLYLLNCPHFCVEISASDLTITGFTIDAVAGNTKGGLNTDGFGVGHSQNILIENSVVMNQDDCVVVNSGTDMIFRYLKCYGTHGLSFSVGSSSNDNAVGGTIRNITFEDSLVADGLYGIHVKTKRGTGLITDVTYKNIRLSGISEDGIYINQDYGDIGNYSRQIEIKDLKIIDVYGSVQGVLTRPVHIACSAGKCSNWSWSGVTILGGGISYCNFLPENFLC